MLLQQMKICNEELGGTRIVPSYAILQLRYSEAKTRTQLLTLERSLFSRNVVEPLVSLFKCGQVMMNHEDNPLVFTDNGNIMS